MIRFVIFTFLSSLVIIEARRPDFLSDLRYYKRIYSSLFGSLNDMSPEQFKVLHRLIDLGVLPTNIREPVNILRNLPARVVYPHPPRNMPQLIPIVSTIMELNMEEIKTILKLRYHGALANNVLSTVANLNTLTKKQLDIIQSTLNTQPINQPIDLLKNFQLFYFTNREKLKLLSESGDIPDIVKYVDRLKPFGFGHINRIIKDFKLDKIVDEKFTSQHSTESSSTKTSEQEITKSDLNFISETESKETTLSISSIDPQNSGFLINENTKPLTSSLPTTMFSQLEENSKDSTVQTFSEEPSKNEMIESMTTENREDNLTTGFNPFEMGPTTEILEVPNEKIYPLLNIKVKTEATDAHTEMDSLVIKNNQNESLFNNSLGSNFEISTAKYTDEKYALKNSDNFEVLNENFTEKPVFPIVNQYQFTKDSMNKEKNLGISQTLESTVPLEIVDQKDERIASKFLKRDISSKKVKLAPGIQALGHFPFQPENPNHVIQTPNETFYFNNKIVNDNNKPPITITESNSKTDTKFENGCMVSTTVTTTITRTFSQISISQECIIPDFNKKENFRL